MCCALSGDDRQQVTRCAESVARDQKLSSGVERQSVASLAQRLVRLRFLSDVRDNDLLLFLLIRCAKDMNAAGVSALKALMEVKQPPTWGASVPEDVSLFESTTGMAFDVPRSLQR